jgi:cell division protein FtsZ
VRGRIELRTLVLFSINLDAANMAVLLVPDAFGIVAASGYTPDGDSPHIQRRNVMIKIKVVGVGNVGVDALNLISSGLTCVTDFIAVGFDRSRLEPSGSPNKFLLVDSLEGESGDAGSMDMLRSLLQGTELVFVACGAGVETSSASGSTIADIAKQTGAFVTAVAATPFSPEETLGFRSYEREISSLKEHADAVIMVPGEGVLKMNAGAPEHWLLKMASHAIARIITVLLDMLKPGPGGLSISESWIGDVKYVLSGAGTNVIGVGIGEGYGEDRASAAAYNAVNSPLMKPSVRGAEGLIYHLYAAYDVNTDKLSQAHKIITDALGETVVYEDIPFIWGHTFKTGPDDAARVVVMAPGRDA